MALKEGVDSMSRRQLQVSRLARKDCCLGGGWMYGCMVALGCRLSLHSSLLRGSCQT